MVRLSIFALESGGYLSASSVLQDRNVPKQGDHYIRSIKFSPDSKLLATGAEDYKLRVRQANPHSLLSPEH